MTRYCYSVFALAVESEIELPGLPPGEGLPDVVIRLGRVQRNWQKATLHEEFAFNTLAGAFHIKGGREIVMDPLPGADPEAVRVILLGRIMGFLLRQRGWLPLHASAVVIRGRAILFLGASGSGKSTTAAAFHARGHIVIADDVAAVRMVGTECVVSPALPQLRLFDDSRELLTGMDLSAHYQLDKYSVRMAGGNPGQLFPVLRIFALEYGDGLRTEPILPLLAVPLLSGNSFVRRPKTAADALEAHLSDCASVAAAVEVHKLVRPKSLSALTDLIYLVEREVVDHIPEKDWSGKH